MIPGHNIRGLEHIFRAALDVPGPVLVHVRTHKGRGYRPAERDQIAFHGAALPPMPDLPEGRVIRIVERRRQNVDEVRRLTKRAEQAQELSGEADGVRCRKDRIVEREAREASVEIGPQRVGG